VGYRPREAWPVLTALILVAWSLLGCGDPGETGSSSASPDTTVTAGVTTTSPAPSATPPMTEADSQTMRELAFAYWDAFNAYDAERTLSLLAPAYRAQREEKIRGEISRIKGFGVKLGVTEKSPPVLLSADEAEMYLTLKEPLGSRTIRMAFTPTADGSWVIISAEEVPE
jgi:hypothetical protein